MTLKSQTPATWKIHVLLCIAIISLSLKLISGEWIDEDTPMGKRVTKSMVDGTDYHLVMSDEFNIPGRSFTDGDDPMWTALDKSDDDYSASGGGSLHFYNSSTVSTTNEGVLEIRTVTGLTEWNHFDTVNKKYSKVTKHFKSGMLQSWNKFCFTGGILEIDLILPGDPQVGGLWPAAWILGNLGRATYESSTNNIWPWSYNKCDRKKQQSQAISACNKNNHFGLKPEQGRGATEIDLVEAMTGYSKEPFSATEPKIHLPYADLTLQVAPGIPNNRPQSGSLPVKNKVVDEFSNIVDQSWYEGLEVKGNTSINPFFYGTYLGETAPEEPVTRTKYEVFQADAIGAMLQLTKAHFNEMHTFRVEWQPGEGGRLDWFTKRSESGPNHKTEGNKSDKEWLHAFSIKDESLSNLMGSQIPIEPSSIILNTAVSSNWGFPYTFPDWCSKCYDCEDTKCDCSFSQGFCNMIKKTKVAMKVDYVRLYQSKNNSAHVGAPHTLGCDVKDYPTKDYIKGHEYKYMRSAPFDFKDTGPLKKNINNGGGDCELNSDCGGIDDLEHEVNNGRIEREILKEKQERGICTTGKLWKGFFKEKVAGKECTCNTGYIGPHCLAMDHKEISTGADNIGSIFNKMPKPRIPTGLIITMSTLFLGVLIVLIVQVTRNNTEIRKLNGSDHIQN